MGYTIVSRTLHIGERYNVLLKASPTAVVLPALLYLVRALCDS